MNVAVLAAQLGLDEDEFQELIVLFMETGAADLARLETGLATGDIDQALRSAHTIKGASGNLGLSEISALANSLEQLILNDQRTEADVMMQELKKRFGAIASIV